VRASKCNFKIVPTCPFETYTHETNECAAPHSLFNEIEAAYYKPNYPYWKPSLFSNILDIFNGGLTVGSFNEDPKTTDGSVCINTDKTMGQGRMFDKVGPDYLKAAYNRYKGWWSWFPRIGGGQRWKN
jgi:hypothetical protein